MAQSNVNMSKCNMQIKTFISNASGKNTTTHHLQATTYDT